MGIFYRFWKHHPQRMIHDPGPETVILTVEKLTVQGEHASSKSTLSNPDKG